MREVFLEDKLARDEKGVCKERGDLYLFCRKIKEIRRIEREKNKQEGSLFFLNFKAFQNTSVIFMAANKPKQFFM